MSANSIRKIRSPLILGLDLLAIVGIFSGVYYLRLNKLPDYTSIDLWLITATFITALFLSGTYFKERSTTNPTLPIRTFWICVVGGAICLVWLYLLGPLNFTEYFGRGILPTATILSGLATTSIRYFINRLYHKQEQSAELLYLGYSESADSFFKELSNHSEVRTITIVTKDELSSSFSRVNKSSDALAEITTTEKWHGVIIDPSFQPSEEELAALVLLRLEGTSILSLADFYEKFWYMVPVRDISDDWFLISHGFSMLDNQISRRVKRTVDILLSSLLLIASIPLITISGILIKLTSRGPVFFTQTRVGLDGKNFTIFKLRTMSHNAEADGVHQWAQADDPRITKIGGFLRQTRLDELPQCWNVLQGTMSFVGPRPERPEFTSELAKKIPYYDLRHLVKPGITGWAQVIFPYGASVDDSLKKLQYELFYIKNQSLVLDLNIMMRTLNTVFQRSGR